MKATVCGLVVLALSAAVSADVEFFFTGSNEPYGLKTPSLALLHSAGNGTDFQDGYELTKDAGGAYLSPPLGSLPDVYLECGSGQWAYLWARFVNEPEDAKVETLAFGVTGSPAGPGHVAWYACNNLDDENLGWKRWDGDPETFYFNPTGLVAVTSYGLRNRPHDQPWNLWVGETRTALLGAVACRGTPGEMTVLLAGTPITYGGFVPPPGWNEIHVLNRVVCVPEPGGLMLLALAVALCPRRCQGTTPSLSLPPWT